MRALDPLHAARYLVLALLGAALSGCMRIGPPPDETAPRAADRVIQVVSHGWHTGLVVARADIPDGLWPERADFPAAEYLEVGWGDRDFYMTPDNSLWLALKAALWSNASVLHVAGFHGPVDAYFPAAEIVELRLTAEALERLVRYIDESFARAGKRRAQPLGPGLYGDSRFYPSRERFHLFNTCNVWTARGLAAAGLPVHPQLALTASALLGQVRQLGRCVRCDARPDPPHAHSTRSAPGLSSLSAESGARRARAAPLRPDTARR
jgi:uncharacterized protein (TIGR02117 family)